MCYVYNYVESWICHCKFGLLIFKMNFVMMLCRVIVEQTIIYFKSSTFVLLDASFRGLFQSTSSG